MRKFISLCMLLTVLVLTVHSQDEQSDPHVLTSQFKRIEVVRMGNGADLLKSLNKAAEEKDIKNGVILSGIGSVTDYHFHVVTDKNLPPAEEYPKASVAMDLTSVQGYILNGRVHAHITLADENSMIGGHLEPGTKALTFIIITIGVLPDDADMENFDSLDYNK
ncbi:MAG: DNA-binding protein [Bacteroidales bacterium]|nr:DNA-binding protein [Bacteroidales bacterium]